METSRPLKIKDNTLIIFKRDGKGAISSTFFIFYKPRNLVTKHATDENDIHVSLNKTNLSYSCKNNKSADPLRLSSAIVTCFHHQFFVSQDNDALN